MKALIVMLSTALTLILSGDGFAARSEQTNWRKLGDLYLSMPLSAVQYEYGPYDDRRGYRVKGGSLFLGFKSNRVSYIGTDSPAFKTVDGFGVGTYIPLGRCVKTKTNPCAHKWRGLTYMPFVLGGSWHGILKYGEQKMAVLLRVEKGNVKNVSVQTCPKSGWVRITDPGPGRLRCGLPL